MRLAVRLSAATLIAGGIVASLGVVAAPAGAAVAASHGHHARDHLAGGQAVFVQTYGLTGNAVVAY
jgi:hypothetical protein